MEKSVHTVPVKDKGWKNTNTKQTKLHATKAPAIKSGRNAAMKKKTEHVIHNKSGQIIQKHSYGNDPFPPRG